MIRLKVILFSFVILWILFIRYYNFLCLKNKRIMESFVTEQYYIIFLFREIHGKVNKMGIIFTSY